MKKLITRVLHTIDFIARRASGIRDLEGVDSFIWRFALRRYYGKDWILREGFTLKAGDVYLELHINNDHLSRLLDKKMSFERIAVRAIREVRSGYPVLAKMLRDNEEFKNVKALLGITLLHRAAESLGFTSFEMKPGLFRTFTNWYELLVLGMYNPGGFRALKKYRNKLYPKYVVATREEFMRLYPPVETWDAGNKLLS